MTDFNPAFSVAGFVVGVLVGMTGVGGGSLMTPILMLVFGVHAVKAVGTDLLFASITKSVGTSVHGPRGTIDWRIVGYLAAGSVPATIATLLALHQLGKPDAKAAVIITLILAVALIFTGFAVLFRARILGFAERRRGTPNLARTRMQTIVLGAILGGLVTITSVGAGAIGVTALLILYPSLPVKRVAGTDIAHAVPLTMIAGLGHWLNGSVDFGLLGSLLLGSVPGIIIGSLAASRMPDRLLQPVLSVVLIVVGVLLLQ